MNISAISKIIIAVYCILFLLFVAHFAVNIPYQDDANLLETTISSLTFQELIANLFSADSDHIQVFPKLAALFQYKMLGLVNYKQLTLLLNLLIVISLFYLINIPKKERNYFYFLPIFFFILQPQIFEISFWVLPGLQHTFAILFLILAVFYFDIQKKINWVSLFFAACATFCTGNGFLAFIGILYIQLLYKKPIWYSISTFTICIFIYLYNYKPSASVKSIISLYNIVNFQTLFWSSPFEVLNRPVLQHIIGIILITGILALFIAVSRKIFLEKRHSDLPLAQLMAILIFCGGTALLISLSREYNVIFSRFQYYAFFGLAVFYLIFLELLIYPYKKIVGLFVWFIFLLISAFSFFANYTIVENISNRYKADTYNWINNKTMLMVDQPYLALAERIYSKTNNKTFVAEGEIVSKTILNQLLKTKIDKWPFEKVNLEIKKDLYPRMYFYNEHFLLVSQNFAQKQFGNENWYLLFQNKKRNYLLAPEYTEAFKGEFLKTGKYYNSGFLINFATLNFQPEHYDIYLLRKNGPKIVLYNTTFSIDFKQKIPVLIENRD